MMTSIRFIIVLMSTLGIVAGATAESVAAPKFPPPYSGAITIMPPPDLLKPDLIKEGFVYPGRNFNNGQWLALGCNEGSCKLVPITLKVNSSTYTGSGEGEEPVPAQRLNWDLSALAGFSHVVILIKPHPDLRPGAVTTWYNGIDPPAKPKTVGTMDALVPTPAEGNENRQSILVPMLVKDKECTPDKAESGQCLGESIRVQLREGKTRQWLGNAVTVQCSNVNGALDRFPTDYLRWVGDLDNDHKPDYLIWLGVEDGFILFLSSRATSGQLVGEAGHYQFWEERCD